ncbi:dTDP-4-dehydrorhamnose reductase (EC [uncultured Gammaproteobacteria bacterium]|jgi:dTDP-4-dehydrorhamnose reductase|nr:dTDP-4-dehydrorhamnose reductase (EC 1.1.1.133) [uncultured Gammaproteobacteria bacterium]VVH52535.1 dTDP-4-dehydrorhamnose reductase (EC [uncultured Gammaproteobacteria bacterium]
MRILVTGKTGQLGKSIQEVVASSAQNYLGYSFTFIGRDEIDFSDNISISEYFERNSFDVIINCAAYTQVDKAEGQQELANQINHLAVGQLAYIAQQSNAKLIHISTDYVFDGNTTNPYIELDVPNPINIYAKTKLLGEQVVQNTMSSNALIIRSAWLYSQYGNNFVDTMLKLAQDKDELKIVSDQIGTPTYATDLATIILHIINNKDFTRNFATTTYHYSSMGQCSWYEFSKEIFSICKIKLNIIPITTDEYPTLAKRALYTVLNKDKITTKFNITIPTWQSSLKECLVNTNSISLSVIIVNYKSWTVLQQCLDSFKQFPPKLNFEIIIIDNDSKDGKFDDFAKFNPTAKFIKNSGNNGFSNGCNLGADNAKGEYLLFLNPDVILTDKLAIDSMFEFAKNNTEVGIVSCRTIDPKGRPEREISFFNPWLTIGWIRSIYKLINKSKIQARFLENKSLWYPDWVAGSVILIQTQFFNQIGKWEQDNYWMYYEDVDLCRKVKHHNKTIALLRDVELQHAHGGSSRRNPKTTAITRSEVVTSSHVSVQAHTQGLNRIALHSTLIINTLISWLFRVLFTLPIFWKTAFKANLLTFIAIIYYYFNAPIRKTWKSKRLKNN